ncbi:beta-lactamase family protein [Paraflavitalea pollutisoli]|uniref:beta-lactamase family protein n=1 Tax=Paraflavitalea pollutisoli TaxID=3034143 RepID=UPI0023EDC003|nr:beta-lactamase family protein [Paraflavitalea sp. H1-2-19X]
MQPKLLLALVMFFGVLTAAGQSKQQKLATIMRTYHDYNLFDGAVLVAEHGKIVYQGAFGLANREWNIPNSTQTKFMIGSVSKPLTAALTLIQVQKGLLELDKTVADYLPYFAGKPAGVVTIRQLLSHTSGIPNYDIVKDFFPRISRQYFEREDYLKIYADLALAFTPGTKYNYSSWGYFTLGHILEKVSGRSYAQLIQEDLYDQLGMKNSGSYFHTQIVPNRATGYDYIPGGYTSADFRDQSNTMGTGDIYSTVEDLFKFHLALSNHQLINDSLTRLMFTPGMKPADYGFGWFNKQFKYTATDSVAANFHLGMTDGFISFLLRIPSTNSMVVILCNSSPTDFFGITRNLVATLYNKPVKVKHPVHKVMETLIGTKGALAAVDAYQKLSPDTANYYVEWISMNFLAEQLLTLKRYDEARIMAENNAVAFPDKDLVMVTMGNIYGKLNRKEDAIRYYKKALAIYPGYEEARNRLKELEAQ